MENNDKNEQNQQENLNNHNSELQRRLQILVKAYKEEQSKIESLEKTIKEIKLEKIQNEALISKLRNENNSLQDALSKEDPNFFDNLINSTKVLTQEEINQIKEEKKLCEEQNTQLIKQIEKLMQEKEESENNLKEEIKKLNSENQNYRNNIQQKQTTIESLNATLRDNESNKKYKDIQNSELKQENSKVREKLKNLEDQNNIYLESIKSFQTQIAEFSKLENQFKTLDSENNIFKGTLINHKDNNERFFGKKIYIFFDSLDKNYIYIIVEVDNFYCINVNDFGINYIDGSKNKLGICFIDNNNNKKVKNLGFVGDNWSANNIIKKMACKFSEEECKNILDFYKKKKQIYDKKTKIKEEQKV